MSLMKIIGKSPHEWPQTSLSTEAYIYYFISYMIFGCWYTDKYMKTLSHQNLLWCDLGRLSWERFQVGHVHLPTVVKVIIAH